MELKDFISQTLTNIIEGVREAQASSGNDAYVNPSIGHETVEFDVAVTVTEAAEKKGGGGIAVAGFLKAEGGGLSSSSNSSVSRIKFAIPVKLPSQPPPKDSPRPRLPHRSEIGRLG